MIVPMLSIVPPVKCFEIAVVRLKSEQVQVSARRPMRMQPHCHATESRPKEKREQQREDEQDSSRAATYVTSPGLPACHG